MFLKGQKIVCINDAFQEIVCRSYNMLPRCGPVYTVRAVYVGRGQHTPTSPGASDGEIGILLVEIDNSAIKHLAKNGLEPGFNAERFAPLDELPMEALVNETIQTVTA